MPNSATATANGIASLLGDTITLPDSVGELSKSYKSAKPFPHLVFENMFSNQMLDELVAELPSIDRNKWVHEDNDHIQQYNLRSAVDLGKTGYQLSSLLHSAKFLYFLSEVTGIWSLLPDPYLQGAGYHVVPRGGSFDIHADRNTAYETGLMRRLSLIIYLNKNWKHEYGGQLELWNSTATRCEAVIEPEFNRTILFEITDTNFHGLPNPIACPEGQTRNAFVTYFHTATLNNQKVVPHTSIYAPNFYRKDKLSVRQMVKDCIPPILVRGLKKMRGAD
jgi:hypothetical protein